MVIVDRCQIRWLVKNDDTGCRHQYHCGGKLTMDSGRLEVVVSDGHNL